MFAGVCKCRGVQWTGATGTGKKTGGVGNSANHLGLLTHGYGLAEQGISACLIERSNKHQPCPVFSGQVKNLIHIEIMSVNMVLNLITRKYYKPLESIMKRALTYV